MVASFNESEYCNMIAAYSAHTKVYVIVILTCR